MTKKNHAEIVCIIDSSGSMEIIRADAIGGFNTFVEEQRKVPGTATLTFVQFNHEYEIVYEGKPLDEVPKLDDNTFVPRGSTALLDAVGRTINSVGERLSKLDEADRPEKIIFAILTDGEENASKEFRREQIKDMITHQKEKYSWEFIFLAANQDAFVEGVSMGFTLKDCFNYTPDSEGTGQAYRNMSQTVCTYRVSQ